MDMQEKIRRIKEHLGKEPNIAISNTWPMELYSYIGDNEVLIHVQVEADPEAITRGQMDEQGWEAAYFRVFGRMSIQDEPIEVQAKVIYDVWTKKGFKPDRTSSHPMKHALALLSEVIERPDCPSAAGWFHYATTNIQTWLFSNPQK